MENISESLAQINSNQTPMSEEEIFAFLNSNEGRREIENALHQLQKVGVHGIPKFIIEGSRVVDGAASSDVFIKIFRDIISRGEIARGPVFGDILGVSEDIIKNGSYTRETLLRMG